jgi:hypothetical protein
MYTCAFLPSQGLAQEIADIVGGVVVTALIGLAVGLALGIFTKWAVSIAVSLLCQFQLVLLLGVRRNAVEAGVASH